MASFRALARVLRSSPRAAITGVGKVTALHSIAGETYAANLGYNSALFHSRSGPGPTTTWAAQCIQGARGLTSSTACQQAEQGKQAPPKEGQVATASEQYDEITDKIPVKPVGAVEGTSYFLVILAGLAVAGGAAYAVISELLLEPTEYVIFNKALERVKNDPRVTVRLGDSITGYGSEGRSRSARQHIRHREYYGPEPYKHVAVQFYIRGPHGNASVSADMFLDNNNEWQFQYLYVEMGSGSRIVLETPP